MIVSATLSREQFLGWIGGSFSPRSNPLSVNYGLPNLSADEVLLIWEASDVERSDPIIVLEDYALSNFMAFAATYISTHTPFTAFFHVIPLTLVPSLMAALTEPAKGKRLTRLVGVVIAEAYLQIGERARSLSDISVLACRATLSNAILTAHCTGYSADVAVRVSADWSRARRLLADDPLKLPVDAISEFWAVVLNAWEDPSSDYGSDTFVQYSVHRFLKSFLKQGRIDKTAWEELTFELPDFRRALQILKGTREDQIRSFDKLMSLLVSANHVDRLSREMVAGVLLSIVSQGSFSYLQISQSLERHLPASALWFALFASLQEASDVLTIGDCLGRRLHRYLVDVPSPMASPEADVAVDELEVLIGSRHENARFRTESSSSIVVELLPGVCSRFRTSRIVRADGEGTSRMSNIDLRELRQAVLRVNRIVEKLDGLERPEQPELFAEKPTRQKYPRNR